MNVCPIDDCTAPVRSGNLMCRSCWARTPRSLQHAVNASWGTVKYDVASYREARDECLQWHKDNPRDERQGRLV